MIGLVKNADHSSGYTPRYKIEIHGEDLLIDLDNVTIFRCGVSEIEKNTVMIIEHTQKKLLSGLKEKIIS